jgi:hypothetical protein
MIDISNSGEGNIMIANLRVSDWGCTACYLHKREDGKHHCSYCDERIEELLICPLGESLI